MFLDTILAQIKSLSDSDYCQALLNCCLKVHYDDISSNPDLVEKVQSLRTEMQIVFSGLDSMLNHNLCMISSFTGV